MIYERTMVSTLTAPHPSVLKIASRMLFSCSSCCLVVLVVGPLLLFGGLFEPEVVAFGAGPVPVPPLAVLFGQPLVLFDCWDVGGCCPFAFTLLAAKCKEIIVLLVYSNCGVVYWAYCSVCNFIVAQLSINPLVYRKNIETFFKHLFKAICKHWTKKYSFIHVLEFVIIR